MKRFGYDGCGSVIPVWTMFLSLISLNDVPFLIMFSPTSITLKTIFQWLLTKYHYVIFPGDQKYMPRLKSKQLKTIPRVTFSRLLIISRDIYCTFVAALSTVTLTRKCPSNEWLTVHELQKLHAKCPLSMIIGFTGNISYSCKLKLAVYAVFGEGL